MEKEKRLIDAIELANFFGFMRKMWSGSEIMNVIHEAETVDAVEVVHGRWVKVDIVPNYMWNYRCSCCHSNGERRYNYCPNCGAKMDGGNEDENS